MFCTRACSYAHADHAKIMRSRDAKLGNHLIAHGNRPFPSHLVPHLQNESSCKSFHMNKRFRLRLQGSGQI